MAGGLDDRSATRGVGDGGRRLDHARTCCRGRAVGLRWTRSVAGHGQRPCAAKPARPAGRLCCRCVADDGRRSRRGAAARAAGCRGAPGAQNRPAAVAIDGGPDTRRHTAPGRRDRCARRRSVALSGGLGRRGRAADGAPARRPAACRWRRAGDTARRAAGGGGDRPAGAGQRPPSGRHRPAVPPSRRATRRRHRAGAPRAAGAAGRHRRARACRPAARHRRRPRQSRAAVEACRQGPAAVARSARSLPVAPAGAAQATAQGPGGEGRRGGAGAECPAAGKRAGRLRRARPHRRGAARAGGDDV